MNVGLSMHNSSESGKYCIQGPWEFRVRQEDGMSWLVIKSNFEYIMTDGEIICCKYIALAGP